MFEPKYTITNKILHNSRLIGELVGALNSKTYPQIIKANLRKRAIELSSFTSVGIEGNPLSLTAVREILKSKPENLKEAEQEVINYNKALLWLSGLTSKGEFLLSKKDICKTQSIVTTNVIKNPSDRGKYRKTPVVIYSPLHANSLIYLPPNHQDVNKLMNELVKFVNSSKEDIDPLILAGIFHKQFVIIHPFIDGNGRTSRLLSTALLANLGLNLFNLLSFENFYHKNIAQYFDKVGLKGDYYELIKKKEIDFTLWLEYFTEGIIDELRRLEKLLPKGLRLQDHDKKILGYIKRNNSITMRDYEKLTLRKRATRKKDFKVLVESKILRREGKGRATYYTLYES